MMRCLSLLYAATLKASSEKPEGLFFTDLSSLVFWERERLFWWRSISWIEIR
jgi:hypothetical protein